MKKTIQLYLVILMLLGISFSAYAQQSVITGKVTGSDDKLGIAGASVLVKGKSIAVITENDGSYKINAKEGETLVFSFMGYTSREVSVKKSNVINVELEVDATYLDDAVIVGYGSQKKANLTGAVSSISVEKTLENRPITDVGRALQGSTPGLTVFTSSGQIGVKPNIKIRGVTGSLNGSSNPLILVDNVEVPDLNYVNPDDIESISILKDASTTAIYGSRGAFGVILITTKKGRTDGKVNVTYTNNFAWSTPTKKPEQTRADLNLDYSFKQQKGLGSSANEFGYTGFYYNEETIRRVKEYNDLYGYGKQFGSEMVEGRDFDYRPGGGAYFYRPWDIDDIYYKKWTPRQNHNISVNGGTDKFSYTMGVGYIDQKGVQKIVPDTYKRYNLNLHVSSKINDWITLRGKTSLTRVDSEINTFSFTGDTHVPMMYFYRWHPTYPYGTYNGEGFRTPLNEMLQAKPVEYGYYYSTNTLGTTINIVDGLKFDFDYTYWYSFDESHVTGGIVHGVNHWNLGAGQKFDDVIMNYYDAGSAYDYAAYNTYRSERNIYIGSLTYEKTFGNHYFKVQGGFHIEDNENVGHNSSRNKLIDYNKGELNLAYGDEYASSSHRWWATAGFFGRINYTFRDRYLLEVNARYDGSSRFPRNDQWALFPSFSVGYILTEESFMEFAKPWLNTFKVRFSYGSVGNDDVGYNRFISTLGTARSPWLIDNKYPAYSGVPNLVSPTLTWEKVTTSNLGFDVRVLKNKLGLTFEMYERVTSDIISAGEAVSSVMGISPAARNYSEITTRGIELQLDFNHTFGNGLKVNASANLSDFTTKLTKFASSSAPAVTSNYEGKTIGEIWGYRTNGLYQVADFVYDANGNIVTVVNPADKKTTNQTTGGYPYQSYLESGTFKFGPGDVRFVDVNGDGVINNGANTVDNHGDLEVIGNTQPRFSYGFRLGAAWHGVDFDIFFQGVGSRQIWATGNMVLPGYMGGEGNYAHTLDYWTTDNPGAFYPRPINYAQTQQWNYVRADRYLLNAAYLRCKTLSLGYTLPKHWTEKVNIEKLRVFFSAENLFEFDKMGDIPIDAEIDWDAKTSNDSRYFGRSYPYTRTLSFGIQLSL